MNKRAFEHTYTTPVPKRARTNGGDLPLTNTTTLSLASPRVPASPSAFETFPAQAFTQFVQDIKYKATRALQENEEADAALARERQWQADREKKLLEKQALLEKLLKEKEEAVEAALDRAIEEAQRPVAAKRLPGAKLQTDTNQSDSEGSFDDDEISGQEDVSEGDLLENDEEEGDYSEYSADELALTGDQLPATEHDDYDDEYDEESEDYDPPQVAQPLEILSSADDDIRHSFRRESAADHEAEFEEDIDIFDRDDEASLAEYEEAVSVDEQSGASVTFAEDTEVAIDPELEGPVIVQAQPDDILTTNDLPQENSRVLFDELAEQSSAEASDAVPEELIPVFDDDDEAVEASSAELNNEEDRYDNEPEEDHVPIDVLLERGDELSEQDLNTLRSPRHDESFTIDTTTQAPVYLEPTVIEDSPVAAADVSVEEMLFQEMDRARRLSQLEQQRPIDLLVTQPFKLPIAGDQTVSRRSSDAPRESVDGALYANESSVRGLPPRKRSDATKRPLLDTDHHALHAPVFALSPVADSPVCSPRDSGETHDLEATPPALFGESVINTAAGMELVPNLNEAAEEVVDSQDKMAEAIPEEPMTAVPEQEAAVVQGNANALLQSDQEVVSPTEHAVANAPMHHSVEETTTAAAPAEPIIEDLSHIVDATEKGFHVARSAEQVISVQDKLVEDQAGRELAPMSQAEAAIFDEEAEYLALLDATPVQTSQRDERDASLVLPATEETLAESPAPAEPLASIIPDDLVLEAGDDDASESQAEPESDSASLQGDLADFVAEAASEHDETERVGGEDEPSTAETPVESDADLPDQASVQNTPARTNDNDESAEAASQAADALSDVSRIDVTEKDDADRVTSPKSEGPIENEAQGATSTESSRTFETAVVAHQPSGMAAIEEEPEAGRPVDAIEEEPEANERMDDEESVERLQTPPPVDNPEEILHTHALAPTSPVPVIVHRLRDGAEYVDDGHDLSILAEHDDSHHEGPVPGPRKHFKPRVVIRRSSRSTRGATPDDAAIAEASMKSSVKVKSAAAPTKSAGQTRQPSIEPAEGVRRSQRKK
ncbi:hypothetical protein BCR37DRAFT_232608 [Protomyces lactucae-debilis]|uniref:Uncharacterized protein n=1 Tax=Protomyces lactucae-debilis TaxID=2754530 RepID=A0A1Y2EPM5_PROLT|nr:uncharacterized protein BCR37DRAFT_232608 [Protomyces lactucae-debilis]ORY73467.1 hypothetical protein BCR37DRAFT_232608 [Protomyces lactucae-debilis]